MRNIRGSRRNRIKHRTGTRRETFAGIGKGEGAEAGKGAENSQVK